MWYDTRRKEGIMPIDERDYMKIRAFGRFWSQVEIPAFSITDCWLWKGALGPGGYGQCTWGGSRFPHRVSYEIVVGPIPENLVIDHLCRVRLCVNPYHLEPVTQSVNLLRGNNQNRDKVECHRGHPFRGENLYINKGKRYCRTCKRLRKEASTV